MSYARVQLNPNDVAAQSQDALILEGRFEGGINTDVSQLDVPLNMSPDLSGWIYERGRLRGDFAPITLGAAAEGRLLALGSYADDVSTFATPNLFRAWRRAGSPDELVIESSDDGGATWTEEAAIDVTTLDFLIPTGFAGDISWAEFPDQQVILFGSTRSTDLLAIWDESSSFTTIPSSQAALVARFGDRAIGLQAQGDVQALRFSVNGDPTDFVGVGSGFRLLVSNSRANPIDPLTALIPLSSDVAALFRDQSIWRVTRTGNALNPFSFLPWIEEVGAPSYWSPKSVPGGVMFMGSNYHVYYLTESSLQDVADLTTRLIATEVSAGAGGPQGVYNPGDTKYRLHMRSGILNFGVHTFEFDEFARTQRLIWSFFDDSGLILRVPAATRFFTHLRPQLIYDDGTGQVFRADYLSGMRSQYWRSPSLSRESRMSDYSLARVVVRYFPTRNGGGSTMALRASGDGGNTWVASQDGAKSLDTIALPASSVKRVAFHWDTSFQVTGNDIRFEIVIDPDDAGGAIVHLDSWRAELLDRGASLIPAAGDID